MPHDNFELLPKFDINLINSAVIIVHFSLNT